jgi:hypothetical protein
VWIDRGRHYGVASHGHGISGSPPTGCWGGLVSEVAQRDTSAFGQDTAAFAQGDNGAGTAISSYTTTTNCGGL